MNRRNWLFSAIAGLFGLGARRVVAEHGDTIRMRFPRGKTDEEITRLRTRKITKSELLELFDRDEKVSIRYLSKDQIEIIEPGAASRIEIIKPGDVILANDTIVSVSEVQ